VRQASIKAETSCRIMSIERDAFKRMLGPIEDILKRNEEKYKLYVAQ
jgi:cAMP-dependent protein kinase regulator